MITDLHKWARLFAAFAIILGTAYSLVASTPDPLHSMSGYRDDLLGPAAVLGIAAAVLGLTAFRMQWVEQNRP
jgi:hypothetical protein